MRSDEGDIRRCLQTERLVSLSTALAAVEEVLLDVLKNGEPGAASLIRGSVDAVSASDALAEVWST